MPLVKEVSWQHILRQNITSSQQLTEYLKLDQSQQERILANPRFTLNIPLRLAQKIKKGTLDDPILKQFLPLQEESVALEGYSIDPVGDNQSRCQSKLLKKYEGRALLVCTSACAMHCRYCFRQYFDYEVQDKLFSEELELIRQDPSIHEVILSGGDPLSLSDRVLGALLEDISNIEHIRKIRFHSRFPVGIPERIDTSFLALLENIPQQIFFVLHVNHPNELDRDIFIRLRQLQKLGVVLLNQAVLLRGVNDSVEVLKELCCSLVDHGVMPYYLHQLDRVQGAGHFEVSEEKGIQLVNELRRRLPGYAVPNYVKEISGAPSKVLLF